MRKRNLINLNAFTNKQRATRDLRDEVLEYLGNSIFEITTIQDFAYESLKSIKQFNKGLVNNIQSIEKACNKLFKLLPILKARLVEINADENKTEIESNIDKLSPIQRFLYVYLQFETSPGITFRYLQAEVLNDMTEINKLIKWYETHDFIKEHLLRNNNPRNHEERVLYDYYYRCIKEQRIIVDYYLNKIKKRAIAKANYWQPNLKQLLSFTEKFRDRPYQFASSVSYFDYRKIDLTANKIDNMLIGESDRLKNLYLKNKISFYRKIFREEKPVTILHEIKFNLSRLPLKKDRKLIFEELDKLFAKRYWIGFYSLALTQIEGLFSDMYFILNPEAESKRKALPDKVQFVRPFHELSNYYFDYYQYHIPRLRNRFMHSGFDEDFKLKSFDLLLDLRHLVKMFIGLNNPLIKIREIHIRRNLEDFVTYAEFGNYFHLLNNLTDRQKDDIANEVKDFEKNFLIPYCDAEYVCMEAVENLPREIDIFLKEAERLLATNNKSFDFQDKNYKKLEQSLRTDKELQNVIADCYLFNIHESDALLSYHLFLNGCKKYLSTIDKDCFKSVNQLITKYGITLSNISKIKNMLPADY